MAERDTIYALSSGQGRAGIAVVRLSGPQTRFILETICEGPPPPREARLRSIRRRNGEVLDHALVVFFPSPASFTGEDVAELHLHGSRAIVTCVLQELSALAGARLAEPGEFSRRAFENGKLDLSEVEGLSALIDSETEWQRRQALRLMEGALSSKVLLWKEQLLEALALVEAEIDFSDEGDVNDGGADRAQDIARQLAAEVDAVLQTARAGERIRDGYEVAIIGAPNAGKSSLLNAIARRDLAIVSAAPGTTRDVLECRCDLDGVAVTFLDTAGLREASDEAEQEGIRRARKRAAEADLVLLLRPANAEPLPAEDLLDIDDTALVKIVTKSDLSTGSCGDLTVSVVTGQGLAELLALVRSRLVGHLAEPPLVSHERQRLALQAASLALHGMERRRETELQAEQLRRAVTSLERLMGRIEPDDILGAIFSRFCIGK